MGNQRSYIKSRGYTPSQVWEVGHQQLSEDASSATLLETTHQRLLEQTESRKGSLRFSDIGYRYSYPSGKNINLFYSLRDAEGETDEEKQAAADCLTVDEWMQDYMRLVKQGKISLRDVTLAPVLQIQQGRKHFNTLVVYQNDQGEMKVYLLEPRTSRLTWEGFYPSAQVTKTVVRNFLEHKKELQASAISYDIIYTGQQAFYNDTECGAHHLNYLAQMARLDTKILADPAQLQYQLQQTALGMRVGDSEIPDELHTQRVQEISVKQKSEEQSSLDSEEPVMSDDENEIDKLFAEEVSAEKSEDNKSKMAAEKRLKHIELIKAFSQAKENLRQTIYDHPEAPLFSQGWEVLTRVSQLEKATVAEVKLLTRVLDATAKSVQNPGSAENFKEVKKVTHEVKKNVRHNPSWAELSGAMLGLLGAFALVTVALIAASTLVATGGLAAPVAIPLAAVAVVALAKLTAGVSLVKHEKNQSLKASVCGFFSQMKPLNPHGAKVEEGKKISLAP